MEPTGRYRFAITQGCSWRSSTAGGAMSLSVNREVRFWVDSYRGEFLETTSAAQAIKAALQEAQVAMPTEIYTLQFCNGSSLQAIAGNGQ